MRLAVIVTEYPKTTETFIYRDLLAFLEAGTEVRLYPLAPLRHSEILHEFARPTMAMLRNIPPFGGTALGAARRALRSRVLGRQLRAIVAEQAREPVILVKSLGLVPKSLAIGEDAAAWGADHIHAEFAGHPATAAWIAGRATGIPYSISCRAHDIFRTQRLLGPKFADAVAARTVSKFARRFLLDSVPDLDPAKLTVIHSSVDVELLTPLPPAPTTPFTIAYVGSLQPRKGVDVLLRALARLSFGDWRCEIVGGGAEQARLETLSNELGLSERVRFLGPQGFDAVMSVYMQANVVVAPSIIGPGGRTEGIPNVMIEALALARPAISTTVSGIPELIQDGETGFLVEPGAVDPLARAIEAVRRDPDRAAAMAAAGRRLVEREFSLRDNARRQLEMFGGGGDRTGREAA